MDCELVKLQLAHPFHLLQKLGDTAQATKVAFAIVVARCDTPRTVCTPTDS